MRGAARTVPAISQDGGTSAHPTTRGGCQQHRGETHSPGVDKRLCRRIEETSQPGIFVRRFGKGRVVYFPWDIDRVDWEVMADDHGRLLRNAIDWALDEDRPVTVAGPGVLDVTVWSDDAAEFPRDDSDAAATSAAPPSGR
jgi:hypothetical protein